MLNCILKPLNDFKHRYWLVHGKETRKAYPLMMIQFLTCFCYTLIHQVKEVMVLEISQSELISYLKLLGTLPVSIIFMVIYTKMSVKFTKPFIFNSILSFFLGTYAFIMVMYAFRGQVQPAKGSLESTYHVSLKPIATAFENWIIVLTFIMGEMYGSVVLSLLFWSFCNDICTVRLPF